MELGKVLGLILTFLAVTWAASPEDRYLTLPKKDLCNNRFKEAQFKGRNFFYSGHDPSLKDDKFDWLDARNTCRNRCMETVSFDTQEKFDFFKGYIEQSNITFIWTSGRLCDFAGCEGRWDLLPKRTKGWLWSGLLLPITDTSKSPPGWTYQPWSHTGIRKKPQPDNAEYYISQSPESCLGVLNNMYNDSVAWHDIACYHKARFICEDSDLLLKETEEGKYDNLPEGSASEEQEIVSSTVAAETSRRPTTTIAPRRVDTTKITTKVTTTKATKPETTTKTTTKASKLTTNEASTIKETSTLSIDPTIDDEDDLTTLSSIDSSTKDEEKREIDSSTTEASVNEESSTILATESTSTSTSTPTRAQFSPRRTSTVNAFDDNNVDSTTARASFGRRRVSRIHTFVDNHVDSVTPKQQINEKKTPITPTVVNQVDSFRSRLLQGGRRKSTIAVNLSPTIVSTTIASDTQETETSSSSTRPTKSEAHSTRFPPRASKSGSKAPPSIAVVEEKEPAQKRRLIRKKFNKPETIEQKIESTEKIAKDEEETTDAMPVLTVETEKHGGNESFNSTDETKEPEDSDTTTTTTEAASTTKRGRGRGRRPLKRT